MTSRLLARTPKGSLDSHNILVAADLLRRGKLVAFATETVYGLGANALDADAVARIFEAKGRPRFNPLIVHVANEAAARELTTTWPDEAACLAREFWPGPLTLILPKRDVVPSIVTGGLASVAVRVPRRESAHTLLVEASVPVAAPSANRYGAVSPTTATHVMAGLGGRIDAVLDDGATDVGIESTVVDLSSDEPRLLRPGGVSLEALEACLGRPVVVAQQHRDDSVDVGPRPSPGQSTRHYAPDAEVILASPGDLTARLSALPPNARVGAVVRSLPQPSDPRVVGWERLGDDAEAFARELYAAFFRLQEAGATVVLLEELPAEGDWRGAADRVRRAAAAF